MSRRAVPLRERPFDVLLIGFFLVNLLCVVPFVDLPELFPDAGIPVPRFFVSLLDRWGRTAEPAALERPAWWLSMIAMDAFLFGPFRAAAVWAYAKGWEGIRVPSIVYASMQITTMIVTLGESFFGALRSPSPGRSILGNLPWIVFPLVILARMWQDHPFTLEVTE